MGKFFLIVLEPARLSSALARPDEVDRKGDLPECLECGSEMKSIAFIRDPAVVHRILDHLDMPETSGNDSPRSSPDEGLEAEPVYDHLPPGGELLPDS